MEKIGGLSKMEKKSSEAKITLGSMIKHKILQIEIEQEIRGEEKGCRTGRLNSM